MQLAEAGLLDLDAPASLFVPELKDVEVIVSSDEKSVQTRKAKSADCVLVLWSLTVQHSHHNPNAPHTHFRLLVFMVQPEPEELGRSECSRGTCTMGGCADPLQFSGKHLGMVSPLYFHDFC